MIYYTQLIFVRAGKEDSFHTFEDHVLPLLEKYKGNLLLRLRPSVGTVIAAAGGHPYEVHIVAFATKADFEAYAGDEERQRYLSLKEDSVERVMLIEGTEV